MVYLQSFQKFVHKGIEKDLAANFYFIDGISEGPITESDEKRPERGVIQLHDQFQENCCRLSFEVLESLMLDCS